MLYLSVPCAHILIKHKSTDLEHVMTEQQPVNNTEQTAISMRRHTETGRGNTTQYPEHENFEKVLLWLRAEISQDMEGESQRDAGERAVLKTERKPKQ